MFGKQNIFKKHYLFLVNVFIIASLLILPYYLFQGKLFLGGDDTRLFYVYPMDYLSHVAFFSWVNLSSAGWNFSYQSFFPFVLVWSFLSILIPSKIVLGYFSFSLPFILGCIFFQKFVSELIDKRDAYKNEIICASLFYILSPIVLQNHFLNPLIPIWLIGLIPGICYFFLKFLRTGSLIFVLFSCIYIIIFSFGAHNIPWISGFFMPLGGALIAGSFLYKKQEILIFLKRLIIFSSFILLSMSFWLIGFLMTLLDPSANSFITKAVSKNVVGDFSNAIKATASGTIIYPLLNLYHRHIAFDFNWSLKNIYLIFYDKIYLVNAIYILILFLGLMSFRKVFSSIERKTFIVILISFVISLYLFTVNIGPLLNLYILFGNIPGFGLFRNPYDKFALGYTLTYSLLIALSLIALKRKFSNKVYRCISLIFLFVVLINALPIKNIIVSPLWTTKNIYKNLLIPNEYVSFMDKIRKTVFPTNTILSIPYGIAQYSVIKDATSNNVYAGVSPVIIFSGVNDISGDLSFNYGHESSIVDSSIVSRKYTTLNTILYTHNINYVFVTKNVPSEVKESYLYAPATLDAQDTTFLSAITDKKILTSADGNYELYTTKRKNALISSPRLSFKRISEVKYEILIKNVKMEQQLLFNDTFNDGWNLYLEPVSRQLTCQKQELFVDLKTTECAPESEYFNLSDLNYIWQSALFTHAHVIHESFSNEWTIDSQYIKDNFPTSMYTVNKDGSINLRMVLYYKPQDYFYIGIGISILTVGTLLLLITRNKK